MWLLHSGTKADVVYEWTPESPNDTQTQTIVYGKESELRTRIAELEVMVKGHDPFEDFPSKERGFECSVVVLGKFEYEDEFNPITNWDLCVYWFDEERWHPLNGYVAGDDIVKWYSLPEEREE